MYKFGQEVVFAVGVQVGDDAFLVVGSTEEGVDFVTAVRWGGVTAQTPAAASLVAARAAVLKMFPTPEPDHSDRKEGKLRWTPFAKNQFCGGFACLRSWEVLPGVTNELEVYDLHVNCRGNFFFGDCKVPVELLRAEIERAPDDVPHVWIVKPIQVGPEATPLTGPRRIRKPREPVAVADSAAELPELA